MSSVALFSMNWPAHSGPATFTAELLRGLAAAGHEPRVYRVGNRDEGFDRPFGQYRGIAYRVVSPDAAVSIARSTPSILTSSTNPKNHDPQIVRELLRRGMRAVIHDPREMENFPLGAPKEPIIIRPAVKKHFADGIFIPHPYTPRRVENVGKYLATCTARTTFVKRTALILEANRLVKRKSDRCRILGMENRMYAFHVLRKKFPEYESPTEKWTDRGAEVAALGRFNVAFTAAEIDGGGTEYTTLEAWDGGAIPVVHSDWVRHKGEMQDGVNCYAVDGAQGLADLLNRGEKRYTTAMVKRGREALALHDSRTIAKRYMKEIAR